MLLSESPFAVVSVRALVYTCAMTVCQQPAQNNSMSRPFFNKSAPPKSTK